MDTECTAYYNSEEMSLGSITACSDTEAQTGGLRKVPDTIPRALWVVLVTSFWERFAFWGVTAPWQNYMENPEDSQLPPGKLGLGQAVSTRIYCAFYLVYYFSPLFFAVISDSYVGRFRTLWLSILMYQLGCAVMVASAFSSDDIAFPGLLISMLLIGLGGGGYRAVVVPFLADQYGSGKRRKISLKSGETVVTDRQVTLQYIYNLYFWAGNVGSLSAIATTIVEKQVSFGFSYLIAFISMAIAALTFLAGNSWYIRVSPNKKALILAWKILICASTERFSMRRAYPLYQLQRRRKEVAWDSALVKEISQTMSACRVLAPFVAFYVCYDQMQNNLISQAGQMESGWIPNDMAPILNSVACILLGPIIQLYLYPLLRARNVRFGPIQRITTGFAFIALAMLYATVIQHFIYNREPCYEYPNRCIGLSGSKGLAKLNIWVQSPIYIFMAVGEIFAYVAAIEYAYEKSPKDMEVFVQGMSLVIAGIGSACAMALTTIARDPYIMVLYASLTGIMAGVTITFWWLFRKYDQFPM